ncbi:MAG: YbfB/YjiJ family MFS transporter [Candidatus Competibacterales bacterium]
MHKDQRMLQAEAQPRAATWWLVFGLALGPAVSNGLGRFAYGLILPAMGEDLAWSYAQAGWMNTANALGYALGAGLAFYLIRRWSPARLFTLGMLLTTASLTASGLTGDFLLLSLLRALAGIGGAPVFIAGGVMASGLFGVDRGRSTLATTLYFGGASAGILLSALSIPWIIGLFGTAAWPATWLALGGFSALCCIPALGAARCARFTRPRQAVLAPVLSLGQLLRLAPLLVGYFCFAVGYIVYFTFIVALMEETGASTATVAGIWSVLGLAGLAAPFVWRPVLNHSLGGGALALSSLATALGTLLPLLLAGAWGLFVSAALFGVSYMSSAGAMTSFCRKNLDPHQVGSAVSLFTVLFAIGQIIGPVAAGRLADATSSLAVGFLAAGVILALGGGISLLQGRLADNDE